MDDPEAHLLHLEDGRGARRGARGGDHERVVQRPRLRGVHDRGDHGRRAVEVRDPVLADQRPDRVAPHLAQAHVRAADRGDRPGRAPAVAVEHRQRPQVDAVGSWLRVHDLAQRVQVRAAVVVLHALGAPGGAARVVDADRRALVVDLPRQVGAFVATGEQVVPRRALDRRARVRALGSTRVTISRTVSSESATGSTWHAGSSRRRARSPRSGRGCSAPPRSTGACSPRRAPPRPAAPRSARRASAARSAAGTRRGRRARRRSHVARAPGAGRRGRSRRRCAAPSRGRSRPCPGRPRPTGAGTRAA